MTDFTPSQLNRMGTQRLANYRTNLDFYNGSQWQQTSRHRQLVFNYVKVSIDKVTSFLMPGLGFACYPGGTPLSLRGVQRRNKLESEENRACRAEQFLRQVYEQNNLQQLDYETEVDTAILRTQQTQRTLATIVVPTNVGQELLDVVEVSDERCGISQEKYRVQAIQTDYDRQKGRYEQMLTLGAP